MKLISILFVFGLMPTLSGHAGALRSFDVALQKEVATLTTAARQFQVQRDAIRTKQYTPINPDVFRARFFTTVNEIEKLQAEEIVWQAKFQAKWLLSGAQYFDPENEDRTPLGLTSRELFQKLYRSVSVLGQYAHFHSRLHRTDLAEALLPAIEVPAAIAARKGRPFQSIAVPDNLYTVARGIKDQLDLSLTAHIRNREIAEKLLNSAIRSVPFGENKRDRKFTTVFILHELIRMLYPQLPTRRDKFEDWAVVKIDGELGDWIDGLSGAMTLGGRKDNVERVISRLKLIP